MIRIITGKEMDAPLVHDPSHQMRWDDAVISRRLLRSFHLDVSNDGGTRPPKAVEEHVKWLARHLPHPPAAILDAGCGPGIYATALARLGYTVTGFDVGPAALEHARDLAKRRGVEVDFRQMDLRQLDFNGQQFDAALLVYWPLENLTVAEQQEALRGLRTSLRPGAMLIGEFRTQPTRTEPHRREVKVEHSLVGDEPHTLIVRTSWDPGTHAFVAQWAREREDGMYEATQLTVWLPPREAIEAMLVAAGFEVRNAFTGFNETPYTEARNLVVKATAKWGPRITDVPAAQRLLRYAQHSPTEVRAPEQKGNQPGKRPSRRQVPADKGSAPIQRHEGRPGPST